MYFGLLLILAVSGMILLLLLFGAALMVGEEGDRKPAQESSVQLH